MKQLNHKDGERFGGESAVAVSDSKRMTTPVAFVVFNRPEPTKKVFEAIAMAKPERLLVIADGPRKERSGESDRCSAVRDIVSKVDWPCRVDTNFADENLGCRRRIVTGLNWVFERVEEAIILEDDCLPDATFFPYCQELLNRYREDDRIGLIAGFNYEGTYRSQYSYFFSPLVSIWGWATWRRAWREYDEHLNDWPNFKQEGLLHSLFPNKRVVNYWEQVFDEMHEGNGPNTWDYQWVFTSWSRHWLNILPTTNLVRNIGFDRDATHTTQYSQFSSIEADSARFPLRHPLDVVSWGSKTMSLQKRVFSPSFIGRLKRRLMQLSRERT